MSQFLGLGIFIIVVSGLALHSDVELPGFLSWIGTLPGDLIIKKNELTIFVPITSSLLISAALSFLLSLFSRSEK